MELFWLLVAVSLVQCALGANILALVPMPSRSHGILAERLIRTLDERGHQITYITASEPGKSLGKTKVIYIPDLKKVIMKDNPATNGTDNLLMMRGMSPWASLVFLPLMGMALCDHVLNHEAVKQIVQSNHKFDLILGEIFMDESLLAGFSHRFKAPIVAIQPFMPGHWANYLAGNPAPASYIPDPFLGIGNRMSFLQRAYNSLFSLVGYVHYTMVYLPKQDTLMRKYFGDDLPPIHDIVKNTSLVLINHHHSIGFPRPYLPNMVEIAGMHIDKPRPLPKDLQNFMDGSKDGVILFSMGSNVKSTDLPAETIAHILRAFSRLKQNILWKFEAELANLPKNVKIMKWIPQSDVLAHPNLRVFITHGGLLSTTEAVDRGVPVVGIPIFGDQPLNMKHTENAGLGRTIDLDDLTEDHLYSVLTEVLDNPKFREVAQAKSKLLNDNPISPLENTVWWIEYVLRHKGAPHLRSAAQDLAWYQLYLLDVYALAALILLPILALNLAIAKFVFRKIFRRKSCKTNKTDGKKNN